jgi:hypothetical protein
VGVKKKHGAKRDPLVTERVTVSSKGAKNLRRGNPVPVVGRSPSAQSLNGWMDSTLFTRHSPLSN